MKLLRYGPAGQEKPGLLDAQGHIRDLSGLIDDLGPSTLGTLDALRSTAVDRLPIVPGEPRLGPCVGGTAKFICIGLNYADHAAETGQAIPQEPIVFMKASSAISGPNDDVFIPPGSTKTDWEVELGVVIGRTARHVREDEALGHVAGYCVVNDVSEREYQVERGGTWDKGKGYDTFGPIGPWLVTPDEVGDPHDLAMWLEVDGRRCQDGSTRTMIFGVAHLVSYVSQFMSLLPGDVISTGTPPGVGIGQKPNVFLKPGQTIRLGIEGLGEQKQRTVASPLGSGRAFPMSSPTIRA